MARPVQDLKQRRALRLNRKLIPRHRRLLSGNGEQAFLRLGQTE